MAKRSREDSPPGSTADSSPSPVPDPSTTSIPTSLAASGAPHSAKQIKTLRRQHTAMKCSLPPHHDTISFSTFEDFEVHYSQFHCNRCSNCRRNFPTEHFLLLHIGENHDPLNEARRAKGEKTYCCFIEGCDKICSNPQKRRMHLVDKHSFPAYYDFLVVDTGIDNRSSMLRTRHRQTSSAASWGRRREQRQVKTSEDHLADAPSDQGDSDSRPTLNSLERKSDSISSYGQENEIGEIVSNLSALKLVPPSVRFGRGGGRGGLSRR